MTLSVHSYTVNCHLLSWPMQMRYVYFVRVCIALACTEAGTFIIFIMSNFQFVCPLVVFSILPIAVAFLKVSHLLNFRELDYLCWVSKQEVCVPVGKFFQFILGYSAATYYLHVFPF